MFFLGGGGGVGTVGFFCVGGGGGGVGRGKAGIRGGLGFAGYGEFIFSTSLSMLHPAQRCIGLVAPFFGSWKLKG